MKVKVVKRFIDKHTQKVHEVGDVFTCNKDRYQEILGVGPFVEEVKEDKENK